jgi:hypothetical protein
MRENWDGQIKARLRVMPNLQNWLCIAYQKTGVAKK